MCILKNRKMYWGIFFFHCHIYSSCTIPSSVSSAHSNHENVFFMKSSDAKCGNMFAIIGLINRFAAFLLSFGLLRHFLSEMEFPTSQCNRIIHFSFVCLFAISIRRSYLMLLKSLLSAHQYKNSSPDGPFSAPAAQLRRLPPLLRIDLQKLCS